MGLGQGPTPWIVNDPSAISPKQFEELVCSWLAIGAQGLANLKVEHLRKVQGTGGEYAIDVAIEFTIFDGARMLILVECKHQKRPVEREQIMVLMAKVRDTGAQKGMIFSTSGFQKGALAYAQRYKIAAITVRDGRAVYSSKGFGPPFFVPSNKHDCFVGIIFEFSPTGISFRRIDSGNLNVISEWLTEAFGLSERAK
jgi:restriction system protein